jgi:hypothetical protein
MAFLLLSQAELVVVDLDMAGCSILSQLSGLCSRHQSHGQPNHALRNRCAMPHAKGNVGLRHAAMWNWCRSGGRRSKEVPADQSASKRQECLVDIGSLFIPDAQAAKLIEPSESSLYDPPPSTQARCRVRCFV